MNLLIGRLYYEITKKPEKGATIAEYALVLALVSVMLITVLSSLGTTLQDKLQDIVSELTKGN